MTVDEFLRAIESLPRALREYAITDLMLGGDAPIREVASELKIPYDAAKRRRLRLLRWFLGGDGGSRTAG